jgi:hypothetical protein
LSNYAGRDFDLINPVGCRWKQHEVAEMIGRYAIFTPCAVPVVKWQRAGCNAGSDARGLSAASDGGGYE